MTHNPEGIVMIPYKALSGDSGVTSYGTDRDFIVVEFRDGSEYLYDYHTPGVREVESMKELAAS